MLADNYMFMHTKYRHHRRCRRRDSHLEVAGRCKNHQMSLLRRCRRKPRKEKCFQHAVDAIDHIYLSVQVSGFFFGESF